MAISAEQAVATTLEDARRDTSAPKVRIGSHIGALDGIRGVAILLVLVYHYGASASVLGLNAMPIKATGIGWAGVDLFFVLSGFLITGILYDAKGKTHFFKNFYARRTLRIFPLYYSALLLVIAISVLFPALGILGDVNPLWFIFYLGNVQLAFGGGGAFIDHFWSLAIEEQFYLIWPLLVFALSRRQLMILAICMIVAAPVIRTILLSYNPLAIYVITPARMDTLATGALIALAARGPRGIAPLAPWAWPLSILAAALFVAVLSVTRSFTWSHPLMLTAGLSVLSFGFGSALLLALTSQPISALMNLPTLRWFGVYSYGLYVWHPIVNMILLHSPATETFGEMTPLKSIVLLVVAACITFAVALASYRFIESPFLRMKHRFE